MTAKQPRLLGSYRRYNLVAYESQFFAIPQVLGPVDLTDEPQRAHPSILSTDREGELERLIDTFGAHDRFQPFSPLVPLTEFGPPEAIEIEPIRNCNLRCVMCHSSYSELTGERISLHTVKRLRGLEGRWVRIGALYEPLTHPDISEIMHGLSNFDMRIELITNGTALTRALINSIKDCNFKIVTISFDGVCPQTYERIRRGARFQSTVERVLEFKEVLQSTNPHVFFQINFTMLRSNISEIEESVDFWERYGFDHIGFVAMVVRNNDKAVLAEAVHPDLERMNQALDAAAEKVIRNDYRITLSSPRYRNSPLRLRYPGNFDAQGAGLVRSSHALAVAPFSPVAMIQIGSFPGMKFNCRSPFKYSRIDYDGTVNICHQVSIGNLYQQDFLSIWYGRRAERFRGIIREDPTFCADCAFYRLCIRANELDYDDDRNWTAEESIRKLYIFGIFQIWFWRNQYYGAPLLTWDGVGPLQFANKRLRRTSAIVCADTEAEIRRLCRSPGIIMRALFVCFKVLCRAPFKHALIFVRRFLNDSRH